MIAVAISNRQTDGLLTLLQTEMPNAGMPHSEFSISVLPSLSSTVACPVKRRGLAGQADDLLAYG